MQSDTRYNIDSRREDFEDLFEHSLTGNIIASPDGKIERVNNKLASWVKASATQIRGRSFSDLLTIGGRIYYETHLAPLLRMQGHFDEVAVELMGEGGTKVPVLINAIERRDTDNNPVFIRFTVFKAADRRIYEQNLKELKATFETNLIQAEQLTHYREQFIAVLGHDLRNPVGSILASASLLSGDHSPDINARAVQLIRKSALRISELITNTMDFARTRLGEGIVLTLTSVPLKPVIDQVIDELMSIWPSKIIIRDIKLPDPILCDEARIAQLVSNLLANAITHGATDQPVSAEAGIRNGLLHISVCNEGDPIDQLQISDIFQPFRREQTGKNQNNPRQGLGLGLYISSEIAKAHNGSLSVTSTSEQTCFTFTMPVL
ncbi:PAS domain-containing sensor histidine kinase [Terrimonas sp. NA20]|uniref:histidine kinase n=1 Tax=Terrimonas ginsenosidimutans TaxID=2908004 RepID=A0ABS9KS50_9BACT|nr:PAS domain-containing sensor histidine kinase [Terrimonas ginsenosidimutans]MCG2615122.1 PAS domain-containing sensor histidine kinase [Terrimonas ginsenosidimutans]